MSISLFSPDNIIYSTYMFTFKLTKRISKDYIAYLSELWVFFIIHIQPQQINFVTKYWKIQHVSSRLVNKCTLQHEISSFEKRKVQMLILRMYGRLKKLLQGIAKIRFYSWLSMNAALSYLKLSLFVAQ
jgi:hypothetical protein